MIFSVLIVDDSPVDLLILEKIVCREFENRGEQFEVSLARNSIEAENIIERRLFYPIDLILVDYNMKPGRDGIDMKRWIDIDLAMQHASDTPYVIISGSNHPDLIEESKEAGVDKWLVKTMSQNEMGNVIDFVIATKMEMV